MAPERRGKTETDPHLPIDKGWAWVVCLACMGIYGLVSGGFKSQGVILVELQEKFPNNSATSLLWVFSCATLVNRFSGPINGIILTRTSHRTVSMVGVLAAALSLGILGYLPKVVYMYPIMGISYGLGTGMISLVSFTAYAQYFDKRKALALGITASGSGVGTIVLPAILRALFDSFAFSSAMLLYGGVALHLLILASLIRPMSYYEKLNRLRTRKPCSFSDSDDEKALGSGTYDSDGVGSESCPMQAHSASSIADENEGPHLALASLAEEDKTSILFNSINDLAGSSVLYSAEVEKSKQDITRRKPQFNWRLSMSWPTILLGMSMLFFNAGTGVVYQCVPPLGKTSGVSKELIAILITCAGALEIPCRISNGFLADKKMISATTHLSICMFMTSTACLLCGLISGTAGIVIVLAVMSAFGTSVFSLLPIAIGEFLGQENVTSAMSINFVYQATGTTIATFAAGGIYERFGRWENVYLYSCCVVCVAALINAIVSLARYCKARRVIVETGQNDTDS